MAALMKKVATKEDLQRKYDLCSSLAQCLPECDYRKMKIPSFLCKSSLVATIDNNLRKVGAAKRVVSRVQGSLNSPALSLVTRRSHSTEILLVDKFTVIDLIVSSLCCGDGS